MRTSPYPVPPSRAWTLVTLGTYGALAVAGGLVLVLMVAIPQTREGVLTLGLWGGITTPAAAACMYGVVRSRYRWEWIASWFLAMGTMVYLVVTFIQTMSLGAFVMVTSLPTLLIFLGLVGMILGRAIQLSLIDMRARRQVLADKTVAGEIPEVADE